MDAREELSQEMRRARGWILAVGIIMFVFDTVMVRGIQASQFDERQKTIVMIVDVIVLAYFSALALATTKWPRGAAALALISFWALQIGNAALSGDIGALFAQGLILKILFTLALVRGYKSASRATHLKRELEQVFE